MRRLFILAAALMLVVSGAAGAPGPPPQRVMSLNLCTDQLLLQLLPPERITSVTYLSRSPAYAFVNADAFGVLVNYGTAEEVVRQHPDLVVTGSTSTPAVRALLHRIGAPLLEVPAAETFEEIRQVTREVAWAVGTEAKAEALIAGMNATLAELARTAPRRKVVVAGWDGAGNIPAKGTLFDSILTAAGGENIASRIGTRIVYGRYTAFDLELLVAMQPDILVYGSSQAGRLDLANEQLQHRVVRRLFPGRQIVYPDTLYGCGLPQSAEAARDLRRAMLDIMTKGSKAP